MARIVMKFGGTSVGSVERIERVADRVAAARREGHEVVCVVSAMAGETNRLIDLAKQIADTPTPREMDALLATGEQVSTALLAMALDVRGVAARSFSGQQAGIHTDTAHTKARIESIERGALDATLAAKTVAVVAGFQGVVRDAGHVTTLGRGGSDLTAVAVAAAIDADACEIYTDVDGVYTCDPNVVPRARKIAKISFEEMLELASLGAKVLQTRSVELAMKQNVALHVRTSFDQREGTWVTQEEPGMEHTVVSGIAYNRNEAKVSIRQVPDSPGIAAKFFNALSAANVNVDMIIQNVSLEGVTDLTFTVAETDLEQAVEVIEGLHGEVGYGALDTDASIAKISVVGVGMRSHAGVAAKMFDTLAGNGINIQMISTSEIKISVVLDRKYTELACRELHAAFGLDAEPTEDAS